MAFIQYHWPPINISHIWLTRPTIIYLSLKTLKPSQVNHPKTQFKSGLPAPTDSPVQIILIQATLIASSITTKYQPYLVTTFYHCPLLAISLDHHSTSLWTQITTPHQISMVYLSPSIASYNHQPSSTSGSPINHQKCTKHFIQLSDLNKSFKNLLGIILDLRHYTYSTKYS